MGRRAPSCAALPNAAGSACGDIQGGAGQLGAHCSGDAAWRALRPVRSPSRDNLGSPQEPPPTYGALGGVGNGS
eukprot:scaffold21153_cov116-Isochrysis_galbana.AAC.5